MRATWRKHLRASLDDVGIYDVPPSRRPARLHANESGADWPREVVDELADAVRAVELNRYPDTSARALRALIAGRLGCEPERIVLGNGSAEVVGLFFALLNGTRRPVLVVPVPAFAMFGSSGRAFGYEVRQVPLKAAFELDMEAMRRALRDATLCIITRPNNPTGSMCARQALGSLVAEFPETVFLVDEAYAAFAPGSSMFSCDAPDNQVHLDTLSKRGLAALRVGYCAAHPDLTRALDKLRMPYNLSQTSIAMAERVLTRHSDLLERMAQATIERREAMRVILKGIAGGTVHPSHANMVLVSFVERESARAWHRELLAHGVQVRDVSDEPGFAELGMPGCLRVSTGSDHELQLLARAIRSIEPDRSLHAPVRASAGGWQ